eukprot:932454-Prymnesium_polylepis.2
MARWVVCSMPCVSLSDLSGTSTLTRAMPLGFSISVGALHSVCPAAHGQSFEPEADRRWGPGDGRRH